MLNEVKRIAHNCSCGKAHTSLTDLIVSEAGATEKLIEYVKSNYARGVLIVCDRNTEKYAEKLTANLSADKYVHHAGAHANETETAKLMKYINSLDKKPELLIACGSGSIHDITRYCAYDAKLPFISYPTAASVDGFVSSVAAMTMYGQKLTYPSTAPTALFADPEVYSSAPARLTASGVGDIIGKITALFDWKVANLLVGEDICPEIYEMMKNALDTIIDAVEKDGPGSVSFAEKVMNGLILSGLAMQLQGNSRPASGAEHHMSHFWEMHVINEETDALHGEKVGVGTVIVLDMLKNNRDALNADLKLDLNKVFNKTDVTEVFGTLSEGILKENLPTGDISSSTLAKIDNMSYSASIEKIKNMIDELPSAESVAMILKNCGAPVHTSEIGLPDDSEFISRSLRFSPFVRNRLTLAKLISAVSASE